MTENDRVYLRRMAICLPAATAIIVTVLFTFPEDERVATPPPRIGQAGPLRLLPQLDIITDEMNERRLTAAPVAILPSDFVAIEIDYSPAEDAEPIPVPNPEVATGNKPIPIHTLDDVESYIRTTSLPVLAETAVEVIHVERPIYPEAAVRLDIQGMVDVMLLVDEQGKVHSGYVIPANRLPFLEQAALDAALKYRFKPYRIDGEDSPFWVKVPFLFRLL